MHSFFFFKDTATTEIYTLSLHDARSDLPNQEWMEQMARNVTIEDTIQEDPVKRLKYLSLAFLVASLLAIPAMAQRGRSNRGGATRGIPRSDQVQAENKRTDKDSDPTKGSKAKKTRTREGWEKNAKHKAKGHSK